MPLNNMSDQEYSQPVRYGGEVSRSGTTDCAPRQITKEAWGVSL